jgi:hypothetical protein
MVNHAISSRGVHIEFGTFPAERQNGSVTDLSLPVRKKVLRTASGGAQTRRVG